MRSISVFWQIILHYVDNSLYIIIACLVYILQSVFVHLIPLICPSLLSSPLWLPQLCFLYLWVCFCFAHVFITFWILHKSDIIQYLPFCVRLISLRIIFSRSTNVAATVSFFLRWVIFRYTHTMHTPVSSESNHLLMGMESILKKWTLNSCSNRAAYISVSQRGSFWLPRNIWQC